MNPAEHALSSARSGNLQDYGVAADLLADSGHPHGEDLQLCAMLIVGDDSLEAVERAREFFEKFLIASRKGD